MSSKTVVAFTIPAVNAIVVTMRPGPSAFTMISTRLFLYFISCACPLVLALNYSPSAQAETVNWHAGNAGFAAAGTYDVPVRREKNFPGYPHNTSGNDGIVLALNAPDAKGTPQTSETAAVPEQMTFGAWLWDYLYNGASITVGVGTRQAELKVTEKSSGRYGKIAQRDEEAYFLSYSTRPSFIGDSHFGYTFILNYTTFNMDKQETAKNIYEDLGTRVRGKTAYVVPTLFYQWGEHREKGKFVRLGVGLGMGVAKFNGDIILTDPQPKPLVPIHVSNDSYDLKFAASAFLEARYRHWGIKVSIAGPNYQDETYKYNLSDIAVNLGYSYYF